MKEPIDSLKWYTDQIIGLKTAILAKEKEVSLEVMFYYKEGDLLVHPNRFYYNFNQAPHEEYSAPLQSELQKWLRDLHGVKVIADTDPTLMWVFTIQSLHPESIYKGNFIVSDMVYSSYEEALEQGLYRALELI